MSNGIKLSEKDLFRRLEELSIEFETLTHSPLQTVAESKSLLPKLPGSHIKNLFLRDKKRTYFLLTVPQDRQINLKVLRTVIAARGTLSFGSAERLMDLLGVKPGAVTPFSVINDKENRVSAFLDESLIKTPVINAHPLRNDMTTSLRVDALLKFMTAENHNPTLINFEDIDRYSGENTS